QKDRAMPEQLNINVPEYRVKRPTLIGEELEGMDEVVYVDTDNGNNVSLNVIGATILELCDGKHTAEDITGLILESLPGEHDQVRKDVDHILMEYAAYGLFT
ncbi:MAG: PqqD family protein, partial [Mariprofundus sp.]